MKTKILAALAALTVAATAYAASATFTGRSEIVTTVTGRSGMACEYDIYGQKFWRTFVGVYSCPYTVEVQ